MRALPDAIRPRLGQFVRLLGSDQPGEVASAVAALRRTLAGAGVDLHDLAAAVERPGAPEVELARPPARKPRKPAPRPRPAEPTPRPAPPPPREPQRTDLVRLTSEQRAAILEGLALAVEDADGRLNDWQRRYANDLLDQLGRRKLLPTEKQFNIVTHIVGIIRGDAS